jgi:hypothetical protein
MGGRLVNRLNSGHRVSSFYGRNVLRIHRADHDRLCLHDSRLARPEGRTYQILSNPKTVLAHWKAQRYVEYQIFAPTRAAAYVKAALCWRVNHHPGQDTRACRPVAPQSVKLFCTPSRRPAKRTARGHHETQRPPSLGRTPGAIARPRLWERSQPVRPSRTGLRGGSRLRVQSVAAGPRWVKPESGQVSGTGSRELDPCETQLRRLKQLGSRLTWY